MEELLCLASGLCAGLAIWCLSCGDMVPMPQHGDDGFKVFLLKLLSGVGSGAPARLAGELDAVRLAVDELVRDERLAGAGRSAALGLLGTFVGVCGLAGLVVSLSPVGLVVGTAVGCALVPAWRAKRVRARRQELARQVPDAFRSLAGALSAGRTLPQAISYVGSLGTGPLNQEFARASLLVSCGAPATEAVEGIASRTDAPGIDLMVCALVVSARTGAPLQGLFLRSAQLVERRFELERELDAKTAQVRLSAKIVSGLPACLVALLALFSPDFRVGLATPVGAGCVGAAVVLDVAALFVIRRLMHGVL